LQCLLSDDRAIRVGTRLIYVRWAALLALLVLEVVALTIRFDTKTLEGRPLWLEGFFGLLPAGFDVMAVGAAVVLLVQWPSFRERCSAFPIGCRITHGPGISSFISPVWLVSSCYPGR